MTLFAEDAARPLWIFGASPAGQHLAVEIAHRTDRPIMGYVDDTLPPGPHPADGRPVIGMSDLPRHSDIVVTVWDPRGRQTVMERLDTAGHRAVTVYEPSMRQHPRADVGDGAYVAAHTWVGWPARLGRGLHCLGDLIAHGVEIGDYTSIGFGARILGNVRIGRNVLIGPSVTIHNGRSPENPLVIGDGAVIGVGAMVVRDVPEGSVVVGPAAAPVGQWSHVLRHANESGTP